MNREIKFRVWDKYHKEFLKDKDICINSNGAIHDWHGTEIFDGDVLDTGVPNLYFVDYKNGQFWLTHKIENNMENPFKD